jgi:hypothetical protein
MPVMQSRNMWIAVRGNRAAMRALSRQDRSATWRNLEDNVPGIERSPPLDRWLSDAKDHSAHLLTYALDFLRIGGVPEAIGEVEEFLLFALSASMPFSISSSSIRLALSPRAFAKL